MLERTFNEMYTVYGGQFGSEGKGQIVRYLAENLLAREPHQLLAYRIGGPNAGHTFYIGEKKIVTCQIPGPMFLSPDVIGIIGPEGVISLGMLGKELQDLAQHQHETDDIGYQKLFIDRCATIITEEQHDREVSLVKSIGSTGKGVGAATADKVMRVGKIAEGNNHLKNLIEQFSLSFDIQILDTIDCVRKASYGKHHQLYAVIEGTQGAGLSLHTSGYYPHCTSRECTPQGIWAGCGLHPNMAGRAYSIMVVRTYPIRVAGPSGPMYKETTWEEIGKRLGREVKEITTVTKNVRRVSEIDIDDLNRTISYTRPDAIALTFLDYVDPTVYKKDPRDSIICKDYINWLTGTTGIPVRYVGTGEGHVYSWLQ